MSIQLSGSLVLSGSITATGGITMSGSIASASYAAVATSASFARVATTASYADTFTVSGQIVAQALNVQQVTSSVVYSSGSNVFGNNISNTQQFTGSVLVSGSINATPGIQITGDGSNNMIQAIRGGNTRFVVRNAVNSVGINTDTPNNPLTVNGAADFTGNIIVNGGSIDINPASGLPNITMRSGNTFRGYIEGNSSGGLSFGAGPSANIYQTITSAGNVGIGTTSPSFRLDITTPSGTWEGARILAGGNHNALMRFVGGGGGSVDFGSDVSANTAVIRTNGIERMRITPSGNILINQTSDLSGGLTTSVQMSGVGTSSSTSQASYQVHSFHGTNGNWRGYYAFFKSRGTSIGSYTVVANGDDLGTIRWSGADGSGMVVGAEINAYVDGTPGVNDMPTRITFSTTADNGSDPTERMRITSGGNVLINSTTNNGYRFQIQGGDFGMYLRGGSSADNRALVVTNNADNATFFLIRGDGGMFTGTASVSPYNNTTGAAANLHVSDNGLLFRSTSSLKYKTNINPYTKGLAEVMQLRPVTYQSKNEADADKTFVGLIAEEIHELGLTEFVQYAADGTPDALAYQNMVALAFKAIQELKAENDTLKLILQRNNIQ